MADESSQRPRATELIAALGEIVCDGELPVCERGCSEPCKACAMLFVLADRLEEAEIRIEETRVLWQSAERSAERNGKERNRAEREVERHEKMLARIINWIDGRTLGYPHGDLKELREFIAALRRGDS